MKAIWERDTKRGLLAVIVVLFLVLGLPSCGGGTDANETSIDDSPSPALEGDRAQDTSDSVIDATDDDATDDDATDEGVDDGGDSTGEPIESDIGSAAAGETLLANLGGLGPSRYSVRSWTGQTTSASPMGAATIVPIDLDRPSLVIETTPDARHIAVDLTPSLAPMIGDSGDVGFEMWFWPGGAVVDSRGYQMILDLNPSAELGPFAPGVSSVDYDSIDGIDPEAFAAFVVGPTPPSLEVLAASLVESLTDLEVDPGHPNRLLGKMSYVELLSAMGNDPEVTTRGAAAGVALNLDVDVEVLVAFYLDFYEFVDVAVQVEVDEQGRLRTMRTVVDLGGIWAVIFGEDDPLDLSVPASQLESLRDDFGDSVWIIENRVEYTIDPDLVVSDPPTPEVDRTQEWIDLLRASGLI
ncbi:MAG: hypothetical protein GY925_08465 [Actinomycetia bacterium]|nr:hypothetical protein [Actinomycetes bacterium]